MLTLARGPATGGPLGRAGINFAAVGLGSYGAPLSSRARDVAGGAFGYQKFYGAAKRRRGKLGPRVYRRDTHIGPGRGTRRCGRISRLTDTRAWSLTSSPVSAS